MTWIRSSALGIVFFIGVIVAGPAAAGDDSILTADKENQQWKVDESSATFVGGKTGYHGPTLIFERSKLDQKRIQFTLKVDSGEMTVRSGYRRVKIQFADTSRKQTILLDMSGRSIAVNGKTTEDLTESWQRLLKKNESTIELNFHKSTQVAVRWEVGLAPADRSAEDGVATTPAELDPVALQQKLRRAVFQVVARIGNTAMYRSGLGTVVSAEGDVLIPLDLVKGCSSHVEMILGKEPVRLGLREIDVSNNLALARLDAGSGIWRPIVQPLTCIKQDPLEGQTATAVHWSKKTGLKTSSHKVAEVNMLDEIDRGWQRLIPMPETSRWIVTDEKPTLGLGGAPLVDQTGRLIGLSYWVYPQRKDGSLFLAGSQLHTFLSATSAQGMVPRTVENLLAAAELPSSAFPNLYIPADQPVAELRKPLALLKNQAACRLCKGKGEVHRSVIRGYKTDGGIRKAIEGTELFVCPRCEGNGYNDITTLQRMFEQAVLAVAQADPEQPHYQRTVELLTGALEEVAAINPEVFGSEINAFNTKQFKDKKIKPGDAVVFVGRPERSALSQQSPDLHLISLNQRSRGGAFSRSVLNRRSRGPAVLLNEPKLIGEGRASLVLVGGVFAGFVQMDRDDRMPVLQNGLVVEVQEPDEDDRRR